MVNPAPEASKEIPIALCEAHLKLITGGCCNTGRLCPVCGSDHTESRDGEESTSFKCFACGYRTI